MQFGCIRTYAICKYLLLAIGCGINGQLFPTNNADGTAPASSPDQLKQQENVGLQKAFDLVNATLFFQEIIKQDQLPQLDTQFKGLIFAPMDAAMGSTSAPRDSEADDYVNLFLVPGVTWTGDTLNLLEKQYILPTNSSCGYTLTLARASNTEYYTVTGPSGDKAILEDGPIHVQDRSVTVFGIDEWLLHPTCDDEGSNVGLIAGLVVGVVVALIGLAVVSWLCLCRCKSKADPPKSLVVSARPEMFRAGSSVGPHRQYSQQAQLRNVAASTGSRGQATFGIHDITSQNFQPAPSFTYDSVELGEYTGQPLTPKGMKGATIPPPPLPVPPRVKTVAMSTKNNVSQLTTISQTHTGAGGSVYSQAVTTPRSVSNLSSVQGYGGDGGSPKPPSFPSMPMTPSPPAMPTPPPFPEIVGLQSTRMSTPQRGSSFLGLPQLHHHAVSKQSSSSDAE